ncbi:unnamed protein product [Polarella glacialis]|uniref:Uncharacterized protein n=1 Tax=Polarella glacialis TaxID=89957 RepID=A0A813JVN7_POLGL|nr:unnamed protein product [Polarella glacialis]
MKSATKKYLHIQRVLALSRKGRLKAHVAARRVGSKWLLQMPSEAEQAFVGSVLSLEPLMAQAHRLLQPFCSVQLATGASVPTGTSSGKLTELAADAIHKVKVTTARATWREHVEPLRKEVETAVRRHAELQLQFNQCRTEYLREVAALRNEVRVRDDPELCIGRDITNDVTFFFEPMNALNPCEMEFALGVIKEKLKMIFETNPAVQTSMGSGQVGRLTQLMVSSEVSNLKQVLMKKEKEMTEVRTKHQRELAEFRTKHLTLQQELAVAAGRLQKAAPNIEEAERLEKEAQEALKNHERLLKKAWDKSKVLQLERDEALQELQLRGVEASACLAELRLARKGKGDAEKRELLLQERLEKQTAHGQDLAQENEGLRAILREMRASRSRLASKSSSSQSRVPGFMMTSERPSSAGATLEQDAAAACIRWEGPAPAVGVVSDEQHSSEAAFHSEVAPGIGLFQSDCKLAGTFMPDEQHTAEVPVHSEVEYEIRSFRQDCSTALAVESGAACVTLASGLGCSSAAERQAATDGFLPDVQHSSRTAEEPEILVTSISGGLVCSGFEAVGAGIADHIVSDTAGNSRLASMETDVACGGRSNGPNCSRAGLKPEFTGGIMPDGPTCSRAESEPDLVQNCFQDAKLGVGEVLFKLRAAEQEVQDLNLSQTKLRAQVCALVEEKQRLRLALEAKDQVAAAQSIAGHTVDTVTQEQPEESAGVAPVLQGASLQARAATDEKGNSHDLEGSVGELTHRGPARTGWESLPPTPTSSSCHLAPEVPEVPEVLDGWDFSSAGDFKRLLGHELDTLSSTHWEASAGKSSCHLAPEVPQVPEVLDGWDFSSAGDFKRLLGHELELDTLSSTHWEASAGKSSCHLEPEVPEVPEVLDGWDFSSAGDFKRLLVHELELDTLSSTHWEASAGKVCLTAGQGSRFPKKQLEEEQLDWEAAAVITRARHKLSTLRTLTSELQELSECQDFQLPVLREDFGMTSPAKQSISALYSDEHACCAKNKQSISAALGAAAAAESELHADLEAVFQVTAHLASAHKLAAAQKAQAMEAVATWNSQVQAVEARLMNSPALHLDEQLQRCLSDFQRLEGVTRAGGLTGVFERLWSNALDRQQPLENSNSNSNSSSNKSQARQARSPSPIACFMQSLDGSMMDFADEQESLWHEEGVLPLSLQTGIQERLRELAVQALHAPPPVDRRCPVPSGRRHTLPCVLGLGVAVASDLPSPPRLRSSKGARPRLRHQRLAPPAQRESCFIPMMITSVKPSASRSPTPEPTKYASSTPEPTQYASPTKRRYVPALPSDVSATANSSARQPVEYDKYNIFHG